MQVLLIDDDSDLYQLLAAYLAPHEIRLAHAPDGPRGLAAVDSTLYDAIILDVMMPGMTGLQVLQQLRQRNKTPVIMLTAKGDEADRVSGLELGSDDYLAKPFSPRELLARLRAVVRRGLSTSDEELRAGNIRVDVPRRKVYVRDRAIDVTGLEFDLLVALVRRAGRVVPRDVLLSEAGRGATVVADRTVDVHIYHLRQKLGDDSREPSLIKTVRGIGYIFTVNT